VPRGLLLSRSPSGVPRTGAVEDDIRGAAKFASAAGALACTKFGSLEALPTKAEIIELLQKEAAE